MAKPFRDDTAMAQGDALETKRQGDWRTNHGNPMYTPPEFLHDPPKKEWLEAQLAGGAWNTLTQETIEATLEPFPCLKRDGHWWEKSIFRRMDEKLAQAPKDCLGFGNNPATGKAWMDGGQWEIESIRFMYNKEAYDAYDQVKVNHQYENGLYFHGTLLQYYRSIYKDGFRCKCPKAGSWYGNGAYFTNVLPYAQHYIGRNEKGMIRGKQQDTAFQLPQKGKVVYVIAALLKPGTYAVVPPDSTPSGYGYQGPFRNENDSDLRFGTDDPEPGFDSHLAYVTPSSEGRFGFRPCAKNADSQKNIKEVVIFEKERALPRFIVGLKYLGDGS